MTDLSHMTYAELLDSLRKDLLLDATTDILPGSILASLFDQNGRASFPRLSASAKKVYQDTTVTGLTWPGGTNTASFTFTHGLATPAGAVYLVTHLDSSGGSSAFSNVQTATPTGCVVKSYDPFGNPAAATGYGLYILTILTY